MINYFTSKNVNILSLEYDGLKYILINILNIFQLMN